MAKEEGVFNEVADKVPRKDETWSDTNLDNTEFHEETFTRLKCRNCGSLLFEVLQTGNYETSARCSDCGMYYIVHSG